MWSHRREKVILQSSRPAVRRDPDRRFWIFPVLFRQKLEIIVQLSWISSQNYYSLSSQLLKSGIMLHQGRLFFALVLLVSLARAFETRSSPTSSSMPQRQSTTRSSASESSNKDNITGYSIQMNRKRAIPPKVLIGYGSNSEKIRDAVQQGGVNIVIWSFVNFRRSDDGSVAPATGLSLEEIKETINVLDNEGYDKVLHLMAVGGWNGKHLDPLVTAEEWFQAFLDVGIFHGVDWDLEGNDNLSSIYNTFTMSTLDQMGDISRLLHEGEKWKRHPFKYHMYCPCSS